MNMIKIDNIVVSISCITYNHVKYIRKAIDGFIMQKTSFPIEILIHDDASTDGTEDVIREYETKYPNIIKPIYEKENQWIKGRKGSAFFNFPRAKGKYIALCEGDDYWTDPYKLQKQVDFLEENSDYGMVHTDLYEYNTVKKTWRKNIWKETGYFQSGDIFNSLLIGRTSMIYACTAMIRKKLIMGYLDDLSSLNLTMGDTFFWLVIAGQSKIGYFSHSTATRRLLQNSVTQGINCKKKKAFLDSGKKILEYTNKEFSIEPQIYKMANESLSLRYLELFNNCDQKELFGKEEINFENSGIIIEKYLYKLKGNNRYFNFFLLKIHTLLRKLKLDYNSMVYRTLKDYGLTECE